LPVLNVDGPIQGIIIGDPLKALALSEHLKSLGIWVNAIRSPTVPKNTDRLRITISAMHQVKDIEALVDALRISMSNIMGKDFSEQSNEKGL
jgi:8-amino-7-oxononanoate synthase